MLVTPPAKCASPFRTSQVPADDLMRYRMRMATLVMGAEQALPELASLPDRACVIARLTGLMKPADERTARGNKGETREVKPRRRGGKIRARCACSG